MPIDFIHKEHPKTVGRTEFWKQIKRTVNGKEVNQRDIDQIIKAVTVGLDLGAGDTLADIGCGNAALSSNFFNIIQRYHGIDFSSYLLEIANEFFFVDGKTTFQELDINKDLDKIQKLDIATKVLIYGTASYLRVEKLRELIGKVYHNENISRVYIGNIPDLDKASEFYAKRAISDFAVDDPKSAIGVWWQRDVLTKLLESYGFEAEIIQMPKSFYASEYRYDIVGVRSC